MPDKNDYISRLMNKDDSDIDDILSFADNIKSRGDERSSDKDSYSGSSDKSSVSSEEKSSDKYNTMVLTDNNIEKDQTEPVIRTFHHFIYDHVRYENLPDDTNLISGPERNPDTSERSSESEKKSFDHPEEKEPEYKLSEKKFSVFDEIGDDPEDADEFMKTHAARHPKFYFILGISIFFLTLLGIGACIKTGLDILRNFTEGLK